MIQSVVEEHAEPHALSIAMIQLCLIVCHWHFFLSQWYLNKDGGRVDTGNIEFFN